MSVAQQLSVEEFSRRDWPRGTQLLDGAVVLNEPTPHHQLLARRLERALSDWQEARRDRGEVWPSLTLVMGEERPAPDVMWFSEPLTDEYATETSEVPGRPDTEHAATCRLSVANRRAVRPTPLTKPRADWHSAGCPPRPVRLAGRGRSLLAGSGAEVADADGLLG